MNIKQKKKKSIRTYVTRFNAAALEVRDLNQSIAMAALKGGLRKNDLMFSLKKKYPRNFADLLARNERYVNVEEAFKLKDEEALRERLADDGGSNEVRPRSRPPPAQARPNSLSRSSSRKPQQRGMKFSPRRFHERTERSSTVLTTSLRAQARSNSFSSSSSRKPR